MQITYSRGGVDGNGVTPDSPQRTPARNIISDEQFRSNVRSFMCAGGVHILVS